MSRTKNNRGKKEFKNAVYNQFVASRPRILNSFLTKSSQVQPAWTPEVQILPGAKNLPVIMQKHQLIIT